MDNESWQFRNAKPLPKNKTLVMGIINMTPDSFSGLNNAMTEEVAAELARRMVEEGADVIDIGGESSRPGGELLGGAEEEISRLGDVVALVRESTDTVISVDTYHIETARHVLAQGADIINDVSALRGGWDRADRHNTEMGKLIAGEGAGVILMHMPNRPESGLEDAGYADVVSEVKEFLSERTELAERLGIRRELIWLDPGYGFSKGFLSNRELLLRVGEIADMGYGVMAGLSRKRMVGEALNLPVDERLEGSIALAVVAAMLGVQMVRVHDVLETARAVRMVDALRFGL